MTATAYKEIRSPPRTEAGATPPTLLIKTRFVFYILATGHLFWLLMVLFPLDMSKSSHPHVRDTGAIRQMLYTVWTNYLQLVYFPLCLYLEWKQLIGESTTETFQKLMHFRNVFFTSLVCPTTLYVGIFFWRVWNYDRTLLVPVEFDEFLPAWMQHNLHSVNVVVCVLDLILVPRPKPHNIRNQLIALNIFVVAYLIAVIVVKLIVGYWPYPLFYGASHLYLLMFSTSFVLEHLFFYHAQWYINRLFWGSSHKVVENGTKKRNLG